MTQRHADPLDLSRPDGEIWTETERIVRADPTFMTCEGRQVNLGAKEH